jgi:hypothetical protein
MKRAEWTEEKLSTWDKEMNQEQSVHREEDKEETERTNSNRLEDCSTRHSASNLRGGMVRSWRITVS